MDATQRTITRSAGPDTVLEDLASKIRLGELRDGDRRRVGLIRLCAVLGHPEAIEVAGALGVMPPPRVRLIKNVSGPGFNQMDPAHGLRIGRVLDEVQRDSEGSVFVRTSLGDLVWLSPRDEFEAYVPRRPWLVLGSRDLRLWAADCAEVALQAERSAGRDPADSCWMAVSAARQHASCPPGDDPLAVRSLTRIRQDHVHPAGGQLSVYRRRPAAGMMVDPGRDFLGFAVQVGDLLEEVGRRWGGGDYVLVGRSPKGGTFSREIHVPGECTTPLALEIASAQLAEQELTTGTNDNPPPRKARYARLSAEASVWSCPRHAARGAFRYSILSDGDNPEKAHTRYGDLRRLLVSRYIWPEVVQ